MYSGMNTRSSTCGWIAQVVSGVGPLADSPWIAGAGIVVRINCWRAFADAASVSDDTERGETSSAEKIGTILTGR